MTSRARMRVQMPPEVTVNQIIEGGGGPDEPDIIHSQGTITIDDASLIVNPYVQSQGTVTVNDLETLIVSYIQQQGTITIDDQNNSIAGTLNNQQGTVTVDDESLLRLNTFRQLNGSITITDVKTLINSYVMAQGALTVDDLSIVVAFNNQQGTVTVDDESLLRLNTFGQPNGSITITDTKTLINSYAMSQGTLTISDLPWISRGTLNHQQGQLTLTDEKALRLQRFIQSQGTTTETNNSQLHLIESYGHLETVVSGVWDDAGQARGKPNGNGGGSGSAGARDSTGGNTTQQTLRVQGSSTMSVSGYTIIPGSIMVAASWDNALATGVGENYAIRAKIGANAVRTRRSGFTLATNRMNSSRYGPIDCISDHPTIRGDLDGVSSLSTLLKDTYIEFDHIKATAANGGRLGADAIVFRALAYAGTAPSVKAVHDYVASDWTSSNLGSGNNRLVNTAALPTQSAIGALLGLTATSFDLLFRWGAVRHATQNAVMELGWWTPNDSNAQPTSFLPAIRITMATSGANDIATLFHDGTSFTYTPGGTGWFSGAETQDQSQVGNSFHLRVRHNRTVEDTKECHVMLIWHRAAGDHVTMFNETIAGTSNSTILPGHIRIYLARSDVSNWMDDICLVVP